MIKFPKRMRQIIDFRGVGNSKIHPSDIDAILEFDNKYLIIFELKLEGKSVPFGQRLLFERIVDAWQESRGEAFILFCEHETTSDEIILMTNCFVKDVYHKNQYYKRNESIKSFLKKLANQYNIEKLKKAL